MSVAAMLADRPRRRPCQREHSDRERCDRCITYEEAADFLDEVNRATLTRMREQGSQVEATSRLHGLFGRPTR